jgi:hypothetical protein
MDDGEFLILFGDDEDDSEGQKPGPPKKRRTGFRLFHRKQDQKKREPRR